VKVKLDKKTHTYTNSKGSVYKSVSSLIEQFVPFFDFEQKSYDYSLKYGIPVEEVRKSWRDKNRLSTDYGQKIHREIENLITENIFEHKDKIFNDIIQQVKKFKGAQAQFKSEEIIHDDNFMVAGTSDLIVERKSDFDIIDFKTNKKIKYLNPFEDKFLLFPVDNIPNAEYFKYALQLSLYGYLYEQKTKKTLYRLVMFWFKRKDPENYELFEGEWVRYSLPYLKEEAMAILEYGAKK
jgi:ATP-dependent exoDNAse (exonuclease V) beta subunit